MLKYKIALFTIILTMILNQFSFTLYAEEIGNYDVQILQMIGMLRGSEKGITEEYVKTSVKRCQVAIMVVRLTGNERWAEEYLGTDNFADADLVDPKTAKYLAFIHANPELGMVGIGNNKFDPNSYITAKDYYKVMLQVLEYKTSTDVEIGDFKYEDTLSFAKEKVLSKAALADPFTVNDMAIATVEALKATTKSSSTTLIMKLVEKGIIEKWVIY
jgi:hypothetical protein